MQKNGNANGRRAELVQLTGRVDRSLVPTEGGVRYVDLVVRIPLAEEAVARAPVAVALVLDRSGSMAGDKVVMARQAAQQVVARLDERDEVAVVVFDDHIDVLQPIAPATRSVKQSVQTRLARVDARGTTALHEGWLTGCHQVAREGGLVGERLARCFLLTDGLANVGLTDPEQIAVQAAEVREHAGVATSTFGIGLDYDEQLLGPLAVAGGGQFHHLRVPEEIATTFAGELEGLFSVAVPGAVLELEHSAGVQVEVISQFWSGIVPPDARQRSIALGDLLRGDERHVVLGLAVSPGAFGDMHLVRARVTWSAEGGARATGWVAVQLTHADAASCDAEEADREVLRRAGQQEADRARLDATGLSRRGEHQAARARLRLAEASLANYAEEDATLDQAMAELRELQAELEQGALTSATAKEARFHAQTRSRGQRDLRQTRDRAYEVLRAYHPSPSAWLLAAPRAARAELQDAFRGCLLWGAIGDALARPVEGLAPGEIRRRYGPQGVMDYPSGRSPRGRGRDATQLVMMVAQSLLDGTGDLSPADFGARLARWIPTVRGPGSATRRAAARLAAGVEWWAAGESESSAGAAAAMRVAPVGLLHSLDHTLEGLQRDAILSAVPTHTHPVGVSAAVAVAVAVGYCARARLGGGDLDADQLLGVVASAIEGMEESTTPQRRPGSDPTRLVDAIRGVGGLRGCPPEEAFAETYNGAFALEAVAAALYCFVHSPDDPAQAVLTAVNGGYAAHCVATIAGHLAGAYHGVGQLATAHRIWVEELEDAAELEQLATELARLVPREPGR